MELPFMTELRRAMAAHGFREVAARASAGPAGELLLKRQTWNTNRAIVVAALHSAPRDLTRYLRELRSQVAFLCGFLPLFWGIGIQVIIVAPGITQCGIDPQRHVALIDNQWAIIQSLFLVDPKAQCCQSARTWGQIVTGKYQDAIAAVIGRCYGPHHA